MLYNIDNMKPKSKKAHSDVSQLGPTGAPSTHFADCAYLDNNATTPMEPAAVAEMVKWTSRGNPSSSYRQAGEIRNMMDNFRAFICGICRIEDGGEVKCGVGGGEGPQGSTPCKCTPSQYTLLFTSGCTEANVSIVRMTAEAYTRVIGMPHFVIGATEHKSLLDTVEYLTESGLIESTIVPPDPLGFTRVEAVEAALRPNTALISVMHANNETGCINDVDAIGRMANRRGIPFHTDCTQSFGKFPPRPATHHVDSFSVSFHKLGGPPGVGLLAIRNTLLHGYRLRNLVTGTQQYGLRGGTEPYPAIAGAFMGARLAFENRAEKNRRLRALKQSLIDRLRRVLPCKTLREYIEFAMSTTPKYAMEIVFISTMEDNYLPSTLLMSVVKRSTEGPAVCNVEMKRELESRGVIVSVGSACATSSPKASHVLYAMGVDELVRKGIIRVSFGDTNTEADVERFVAALTPILLRYNNKNETQIRK